MNSIILCEGSTDYVLLQYYMRVANAWQDDRSKQQNIFRFGKQSSRKFFKGEDSLTISAVGGCSKLAEGLEAVLQRNNLAAPTMQNEMFEKIIILTDRDECDTESKLIDSVKKILGNYQVTLTSLLVHNTWISCTMKNRMGVEIQFQILLLVIPFEENGAMETFLLNAVANNNVYDAQIIAQGNNFVETVDSDKRYLNQRRLVTKAKFDVYFSIRTSAAQFVERQDILKNVPWEKYQLVQQEFKLLEQI